MDQISNQNISPESIRDERLDLGQKTKKRSIISSVQNDVKDMVDTAQFDEEKQIKNIKVNIPNNNSDYNIKKSPKIVNVRNISPRDNNNIYNIKTMNPIKRIKNKYQTSTNPQMIDSNNLTSSNDSGQFQRNIFDPNVNIILSKSPSSDYFNKVKNKKYIIDTKRERGGIIPMNNMSPNLNNYEDINSSDQKFDFTNNNIIGSDSQRNIINDIINRNERNSNMNNNKNMQYINNINPVDMSDEINNKYKSKMNQNLNRNDIKKIIKKFSKIYDPHKNNHGVLVESSKVVLPGASDDIFSNRYQALSKMNRLSNILLSKKKAKINIYKTSI